MISSSDLLSPNEPAPTSHARLILGGWLVLWTGYWTFFKPTVFPTPFEAVARLPDLWLNEGLGQEVAASFTANVQALLISVVLSLTLAYLCRMPLVRPLALIAAKMRVLSAAVFYALLIFVLRDGHRIKIGLLVLGETFFLVASLVSIVESVPQDVYNYARTLRMSEWTVLRYTVIRWTLPQVIDAIRDNAAMGWAAIMFVEGFVQTEGGLGVVIIRHQRSMDFDVVYGVALVVVIIGLLQDYALVRLRGFLCPYILEETGR
jgi:NitT/TauT family transport system permease protein